MSVKIFIRYISISEFENRVVSVLRRITDLGWPGMLQMGIREVWF
jgi:hypothetical protein